MVQSVAWVTELKNTQSCLFYLLSIFFFLKWEGREDAVSRLAPRWTGERRSLAFASSLLLFVLATLSKPSVVMLPVVLALCIWWLRRRIRGCDALALAPFALIAALASAWTIWEQKFHARAAGPDWAQTFPERLIIVGRAIWFYLGKLFWPDPLTFIYPRWNVDSSKLIAYFPLISVAAGLVVLWFIRAGWGRALFFAGAYYVISLFPVLGFFTVYFFRYSFVSDHFQYLASIGPLALAGAAAVMIGRLCQSQLPLGYGTEAAAQAGKNGLRVASRGVVVAACLGGTLLILLAFRTWQQTTEYRDLMALYTATLRKNPGCWMAHYNLAIILADQGAIDQAIDHYQDAVNLRPSYAEAHYNLARLLVEQGRVDDAVGQYEKALEIEPGDAEAQNNLGVILFSIGRVGDAILHYQKALEILPDYAEASCNLANALISEGDFDGAIAHYNACVAAVPDQVEAQYNLASALLRKGRTDEAITHYHKVLQLYPENADAHANLGSAFAAKGGVRDAVSEYTRAIEIAPENVAALSNLAWLLATSADPSLRNGAEAVRLAERADSASSRSDNHATVLRILAAAYAEVGRFADAKETAQHALEAAKVEGNASLAEALQEELALYDLRLPNHK
jgi:tetratricopeptide (TPR) repeat protein